MAAKESQIASSVLMIRPARFESNPLTAASNRFQGKSASGPADQHAAAVSEFDGLVAELRGAGIDVQVFEDTPEPHTPDAIFPNNWISFHADGRVVLYPMEAENRRTERRPDIVDALSRDHGFRVRDVLDLSAHEQAGVYLEGTGSMVLDRQNRIAYACLSTRTHLDALGDFAQQMDYDIVAFDAVDSEGTPIYHTNVVMNIGEVLAVVCADAIPRADQRDAVLCRLRETGHDVIEIDLGQLASFAGNMLELRDGDGGRVVVMSRRAIEALRPEQLEKLQANGRVLSATIDTIEAASGGSVRCMLAEIHLPKDGVAT